MYNVVRNIDRARELEDLGVNLQQNVPYLPWEVLSFAMHSFNIKESVSNMIDVKPSCQTWKRPSLIANTSHWRADSYSATVQHKNMTPITAYQYVKLIRPRVL
ncbi:unnamed protein product [Musa textilis]